MKVCKVLFGLLMVLVLISGSAAFAQEVSLSPGSVGEWSEDISSEMTVQDPDAAHDEGLDGLYMVIMDQDGNIEYVPQPAIEEHQRASQDAVPLVPEMLGPEIDLSRESRVDSLSEDDSHLAPLSVEPVGEPFPIANTDAMELNPSIAHGGNYFMVVYSNNSQIYASVYHNNGTYHDTFFIDGWDDAWLGMPRVTYDSHSGLFLVAYHDFYEGDVWFTAVSPNGQKGDFYQFQKQNALDITRYPDVICTHPSWCIIVVEYDQHIAGSIYEKLAPMGRYVKLDPDIGVTDDFPYEIEAFSNLPGERPFLAFSDSGGNMYAMLVYTTIDEYGYQLPVFNYVYAFSTPPEQPPYVFDAKPAIEAFLSDAPASYWYKTNKYATGVAVDPCTNQYMILFDHEYSANTVDVWGAAIEIIGHIILDEPINTWAGPFAFQLSRDERSGGISFHTARTNGAACGVMNKLVVTYTNWDENRIYAVEIRGNNDPSNPAYVRDSFEDHLVVAELPPLPSGPPTIRPAISGGSRRGPMLIAYNVYESPPNYNVWGRLVTVWEGGDEIYLPLIMR